MVPTVERGLRLVVFCSMEMDGTQPVDGIHVGAFHLVEELAGIGGKRLHVTALSFGVNGVKGERGLARSAQAGDDGQGIAGDLDVDVLEVVLARPAHRNLGDGHRPESNALP